MDRGGIHRSFFGTIQIRDIVRDAHGMRRNDDVRFHDQTKTIAAICGHFHIIYSCQHTSIHVFVNDME